METAFSLFAFHSHFLVWSVRFHLDSDVLCCLLVADFFSFRLEFACVFTLFHFCFSIPNAIQKTAQTKTCVTKSAEEKNENLNETKNLKPCKKQALSKDSILNNTRWDYVFRHLVFVLGCFIVAVVNIFFLSFFLFMSQAKGTSCTKRAQQ